ncbi:MAG: hypothetical protein QOC89_3929, partial [Paraburkholderia sp.]|nr:hypothetical protein [Paraburkholderia sp.]
IYNSIGGAILDADRYRGETLSRKAHLPVHAGAFVKGWPPETDG